MLVNDDREYLDQFFVILREHGFQVTTSTEGKEAMERLRREKPDLAIINHTMSVDGRENLAGAVVGGRASPGDPAYGGKPGQVYKG